MDYVIWPSSQSDLSDLSVLDSVPPAQDKDEPVNFLLILYHVYHQCCIAVKSTAPDDPPAEEEKTTQLHASSDRPLAERLHNSFGSGMAGSNRNFVTPSPGAKKKTFSTLVPDPSDKIGQFDEEETTGTKRKTDSTQVAKAESSRPSKRTVRGGCNAWPSVQQQ